MRGDLNEAREKAMSIFRRRVSRRGNRTADAKALNQEHAWQRIYIYIYIKYQDLNVFSIVKIHYWIILFNVYLNINEGLIYLEPYL